MGKLLFLLSIFVQVSCSSGAKSTQEKKTFSDVEKKEAKTPLKKRLKLQKAFSIWLVVRKRESLS